MSKQQELQNVINRSTLMLQNLEDVTKAVKQAEVHPALAELLIKMHGTIQDLDRARRETDKALMHIAEFVQMSGTLQEQMLENLDHVVDKVILKAAIDFDEKYHPSKKD